MIDSTVEFVIPVHAEDLLMDASATNRLAVIDDVAVASLGAPQVKKLLDGANPPLTYFFLFFHPSNGYFFFFFFFNGQAWWRASRRTACRWPC